MRELKKKVFLHIGQSNEEIRWRKKKKQNKSFASQRTLQKKHSIASRVECVQLTILNERMISLKTAQNGSHSISEKNQFSFRVLN